MTDKEVAMGIAKLVSEELLPKLSPYDRVEVFRVLRADYCPLCGGEISRYSGICHCSNDE